MVPSNERPASDWRAWHSRSRRRRCWRALPRAPRRPRPVARPTPAGSPPRAAEPDAAPPAADAPSAGTLSLVSAKTTPRKSFYYGFRYPSLRFAIASTQAQNDLRDRRRRRSRRSRPQLLPQRRRTERRRSAIRWDGTTATAGRRRTAATASGSSRREPRRVAAPRHHLDEPLSLGFDFYGYAFPILGAHDFGGAGGRFGAGRAGHTHQGQDVMAACGAAAGRRPGRPRPVLRLPGRRPATTSSSTARAPATTPCTCTWPNPRR